MSEFHSLIAGYRRFRSELYVAQQDRWQDLASGQEPPVMIIACCDSRVDPATIFDTRPGQAFILRNVANLVPPYETGGGRHAASAAIEFAVVDLAVRHIVIVGHGACGGIAAALAGSDHGAPGASFIDGWMSILDEARGRVLASRAPEPRQLLLEREAIRVSLANLRGFPFVVEREAAGKLELHGCHFAIAQGALDVLDEAEDVFRPV